MFETIQRLYQSGKLTEAGVQAATARGWITQAQAAQITGGEGHGG